MKVVGRLRHQALLSRKSLWKSILFQNVIACALLNAPWALLINEGRRRVHRRERVA
jgi:hypothetical protein